MAVSNLAIACTERGVVPDLLLRMGIRRLLQARLVQVDAGRAERAAAHTEAFVAAMRQAPIAPLPDKANAQHYELPAEFFGKVLGPRRKYSSAWWPEGVDDLGSAEEAALALTCERAGLADGQRILELGCGWGSLTLWMAERYPRSQITALSNSHSQRAHIEAEARHLGLSNICVTTCDVARFDPAARFDRIVSVEMFEHLRNWPEMFRRLGAWLEADGRFFMHVFVHRAAPYAFEDRDDTDWMARYFFSGGMMPSDDLASRFQDDLALLAHWRWDGTHYARTAEAWLANMDRRRAAVWPILERSYGAENASLWWTRWRLFFLSCAELFGYERGQQWWVGHYLFEPRRPAA
ncbi:MAG: cyclopropane-fatty-acyl-phospholipid synthase-like protein [Burkholderiaceae bacterium]|nr:MAG: cyclopropane-fatty-acyl-phospholipid synthase-like protein [Burkholderiaceae bacterium]